MGRWKIDDPRCCRLEIRLTKQELSDIDYIAKSLRTSRAEAIRDAVFYRAQEIFEHQQKSEKLRAQQET